LKEFKQYNFIPGDMEHESVSKPLSMHMTIGALLFCQRLWEKTPITLNSQKRAQAYKNLFDPTTRFMRPRINGG
jgi:putative alpha-1,2-mannosidase